MCVYVQIPAHNWPRSISRGVIKHIKRKQKLNTEMVLHQPVIAIGQMKLSMPPVLKCVQFGCILFIYCIFFMFNNIIARPGFPYIYIYMVFTSHAIVCMCLSFLWYGLDTSIHIVHTLRHDFHVSIVIIARY